MYALTVNLLFTLVGPSTRVGRQGKRPRARSTALMVTSCVRVISVVVFISKHLVEFSDRGACVMDIDVVVDPQQQSVKFVPLHNQ